MHASRLLLAFSLLAFIACDQPAASPQQDKPPASADVPKEHDSAAAAQVGAPFRIVDVEPAEDVLAVLAEHAIPVFHALDEMGKPTGRKVDGGAWGEDVPANMAPALQAFFHPTGTGSSLVEIARW